MAENTIQLSDFQAIIVLVYLVTKCVSDLNHRLEAVRGELPTLPHRDGALAGLASYNGAAVHLLIFTCHNPLADRRKAETMTHEPRLMRDLRDLLASHRVAALGTTQDDGTPFVSMVPYAVEATMRCLVIHVSGLAAHTRHLQARSQVSLLVMVAEVPGSSVHDLPRVTLQGHASVLVRGSAQWVACKSSYLKRYPDVEHMTELGDFRFVAIHVDSGRHVAGFGAARTVDADELQQILGGMA